MCDWLCPLLPLKSDTNHLWIRHEAHSHIPFFFFCQSMYCVNVLWGEETVLGVTSPALTAHFGTEHRPKRSCWYSIPVIVNNNKNIQTCQVVHLFALLYDLLLPAYMILLTCLECVQVLLP